MGRILAVLEPPYRSGHLAKLSGIAGLSGFDVKESWEDGEPLLDHAPFAEDAAGALAVLEGLLAYARAEGLPLALYRTCGVGDRGREPVTVEDAVETLSEWTEEQVEHDPPTVEEIARRALCLIVMFVHGKGHPLEAAALLESYGVAADLSPSEKAYLADGNASERDHLVATWDIEAAAVMLAALGLLPLAPVTDMADVDAMMRVVHGHTATTLAAAATDPDDGVTEPRLMIEEMHWAVRDARINGRPDPEGFDPDVAVKRHEAMAWLDDGGPWDKVDTST